MKKLNRHLRRALKAIERDKDDWSITRKDILPSVVCRVPKHNGQWEMKTKKSKDIINRRAYTKC